MSTWSKFSILGVPSILIVTLCSSVSSEAAQTAKPKSAEPIMQPASESCTAQWLSQNPTPPPNETYKQYVRNAEVFGKTCLGIPGWAPIDWNKVRDDLAGLIDDNSPIVADDPADVATFCPAYEADTPHQRAVFWRELLFQIVKPEAGTNANSFMWEQPQDKQKLPVGNGEFSIGLLQLSISNARPYHCDVPEEKSLLDEKVNLACGVKILNRLVSRHSLIGGDQSHGRWGAAAYWSTIRVPSQKPSQSGGKDTRTSIIKAVKALPECSA